MQLGLSYAVHSVIKGSGNTETIHKPTFKLYVRILKVYMQCFYFPSKMYLNKMAI